MQATPTEPTDFAISQVSRPVVAAVLTLVSGVVFALNVDFLMRGDATTYATYVLIGKYDDLTLHVGYYGVIAALHHTIGRLLSIPIHELLAFANVAFGALTTAVVFLLAETLTKSRALGIIASVYFAICGRVIMNATSSEIYILQTLLVAGSMLLYVRDRAFLAGLAAGLALLVSPLSAFAFLFFPVWELTKPAGRSWRAFGLAMAGGALLYVPYLAFWWEELLWGRRGLLRVTEEIPIDVRSLLANAPKYQVKHFTSMLVLLPLGLAAWRSHSRLLWLSLSVSIPHIYLVTKLIGEDNTFLLNTDPFFCMWLAIGTAELLRSAHWRFAAPLPFAGHVALYAIAGVLFAGQSNRSYAENMRWVAATYLKGRNSVMVSDWDVSISLTHFGRDSAVTIPEEDPLFRQMYDLDSDVGPWPSLEGTEIYLLDPWAPSPVNRLLRSESGLAELHREHSLVAKARRRLGLGCVELARPTHTLYRCERIARGVRGRRGIPG